MRTELWPRLGIQVDGLQGLGEAGGGRGGTTRPSWPDTAPVLAQSDHAKAYINPEFRKATDDYTFESGLSCHAPEYVDTVEFLVHGLPRRSSRYWSIVEKPGSAIRQLRRGSLRSPPQRTKTGGGGI